MRNLNKYTTAKYVSKLENCGKNDAHIFEYEKGVFGIFTRPGTQWETFDFSNFETPTHAQEYYDSFRNHMTKLNKEIFEIGAPF